MTENSTFPLTQNPSSVYLHPSENPANSLVSVKFSGDNFSEWKRGIIITLSCKNKLSFIDRTLPKPYYTDSAYSAWERCNAMVISYIMYPLDTTKLQERFGKILKKDTHRILEHNYIQFSKLFMN